LWPIGAGKGAGSGLTTYDKEITIRRGRVTIPLKKGSSRRRNRDTPAALGKWLQNNRISASAFDAAVTKIFTIQRNPRKQNKFPHHQDGSTRPRW